MAQKLVGQQCTCWVVVGSSQLLGNAASVNGASAIAVVSYARKITKDDSTSQADMSALGDTRETTQVLRGKTEINLELLVPTTGEQFINTIGMYGKVIYKANASVSNVFYIGVITKQGFDMPDGAQIETLTLTCDAN
jgi:hypothetical protein